MFIGLLKSSAIEFRNYRRSKKCWEMWCCGPCNVSDLAKWWL